MKVPIEWLNDYIDLKQSDIDFEDILTMRGLEVESIDPSDSGNVINIELTPNRGDCASILGVAREVAAVLDKKVLKPDILYSEAGKGISDEYALQLDIEDKCPLYMLKCIRGVKPGESPPWLKKRLESAGIRPLNNIIDITNYVMLETGQPLHAFDASCIDSGQIVVRSAWDSEKTVTLDGTERELSADDIVIADKEKTVAIGGVMGSENSAVSVSTSDILLESAFFDPRSISRTERRLELKTEASYRFARSVDAAGVEFALQRATKLISEICDAQPAPGILRAGSLKEAVKDITVSPDQVNRLLGTDLGTDEISECLKALEFGAAIEGDIVRVSVPSFRSDISRPVDIIEEVARVYGYDNIELTMPESKIVTDLLREKDRFKRAEDIITASGYWESVTHTLMCSSIYSSIEEKTGLKPVVVENPINVNMDILRPSLLFGLLQVAKYNINQKQPSIRFFERGPVFTMENDEYIERESLAYVGMDTDFFASKRIVMDILDDMKLEYEFKYGQESPFFARGENAVIYINGIKAGELGTIGRDVLKEFKLANNRFSGGYIMLDIIDKKALSERKFVKWSPYPTVERDISLVVPSKLTHASIFDKIFEEATDILKRIDLYDIYSGAEFGQDKKSMTYTLQFASDDRTLTSEEVEEDVNRILKSLEVDFGITLRPDK